jgi:hypothetical protein
LIKSLASHEDVPFYGPYAKNKEETALSGALVFSGNHKQQVGSKTGAGEASVALSGLYHKPPSIFYFVSCISYLNGNAAVPKYFVISVFYLTKKCYI